MDEDEEEEDGEEEKEEEKVDDDDDNGGGVGGGDDDDDDEPEVHAGGATSPPPVPAQSRFQFDSDSVSGPPAACRFGPASICPTSADIDVADILADPGRFDASARCWGPCRMSRNSRT